MRLVAGNNLQEYMAGCRKEFTGIRGWLQGRIYRNMGLVTGNNLQKYGAGCREQFTEIWGWLQGTIYENMGLVHIISCDLVGLPYLRFLPPAPCKSLGLFVLCLSVRLFATNFKTCSWLCLTRFLQVIYCSALIGQMMFTVNNTSTEARLASGSTVQTSVQRLVYSSTVQQ